jgi:hypothetical protein
MKIGSFEFTTAIKLNDFCTVRALDLHIGLGGDSYCLIGDNTHKIAFDDLLHIKTWLMQKGTVKKTLVSLDWESEYGDFFKSFEISSAAAEPG